MFFSLPLHPSVDFAFQLDKPLTVPEDFQEDIQYLVFGNPTGPGFEKDRSNGVVCGRWHGTFKKSGPELEKFIF